MSGPFCPPAARAASAWVVLMGLAVACSKGETRDEEAIQSLESSKTEDASGSVAAVPIPLDPSYVPNDALEQLEGMALESFPPCIDTIATLKPALDSIAAFRKQLAEAATQASVVQLLTALSSELSSRVSSIATRSETDELRRISAELNASIADLAESLKGLSDAITAHDKQASAQASRRIQNGVTNTRSSIERLIDQCAS